MRRDSRQLGGRARAAASVWRVAASWVALAVLRQPPTTQALIAWPQLDCEGRVDVAQGPERGWNGSCTQRNIYRRLGCGGPVSWSSSRTEVEPGACSSSPVRELPCSLTNAPGGSAGIPLPSSAPAAQLAGRAPVRRLKLKSRAARVALVLQPGGSEPLNWLWATLRLRLASAGKSGGSGPAKGTAGG